jgi:hypothetical protein
MREAERIPAVPFRNESALGNRALSGTTQSSR